jgi:hypothetical protein
MSPTKSFFVVAFDKFYKALLDHNVLIGILKHIYKLLSIPNTCDSHQPQTHTHTHKPGNTKGESITVPLTSCLICLD